MIIEHRVDEVAPWADRVVLMDDGRVVLDRPPREAWADQAPWLATGVGVPDLVRLAHALPDAFPGARRCRWTRRSRQARGTWLVPALAQAARPRRGPPGRPGRVPPGPPVLSWDHVTVDFDARRAVDDVTLSDRRRASGSRMIGANGSGKSTLTGLTVGLSAATKRDGVASAASPIRPGKVFEHAAHVALLLQAADEMLFEETVIGELEFGSRFRALPPDPVLDVAGRDRLLRLPRPASRTVPWELSQGGRQRLALAALLVGAPGVLVLDEPTTGQDAERMRSFLRLLEAGARADRADRADRHP